MRSATESVSVPAHGTRTVSRVFKCMTPGKGTYHATFNPLQSQVSLTATGLADCTAGLSPPARATVTVNVTSTPQTGAADCTVTVHGAPKGST